MGKLSSVQRKDALERFASGEPASSIASDYGVTRGAILHAASTAGVKGVAKEEKHLSILPAAAKMYQSGATIAQVSQKFGINRGVMGRMLRKATAIRCNPKVSVDDTVFDEVNEESAYWAGFLMADGCIGAKVNNRQQVIGLSLQSGDREHVEKFLLFLNCTATISDCMSTAPSGNSSLQSSCAVTSQKLSDSLRRYGLAEGKTYCARASDLIAMNRHFWRGMIDGDGCISDKKPGRNGYLQQASIGLIGTKDIIEKFTEFCAPLIDGWKPTITKTTDKITWKTSYSCAKAKLIINHLYSDCSIALNRKLAIADRVRELPEITDAYKAKCPNLYGPKEMAWCGGCKEHLPSELFGKCSTAKHGLKGRCKSCRKIERQKRKRKTAVA